MKMLLITILSLSALSFAQSEVIVPVDIIADIQTNRCAELSTDFDKKMKMFNINKSNLPGKVFNYTNCTETLKLAVNDLSGQCLVSEEQNVNLADLSGLVTSNCNEFYPVIKDNLGSFYANDFCKNAYTQAKVKILTLLKETSQKRAEEYEKIRLKILLREAKKNKQPTRL